MEPDEIEQLLVRTARLAEENNKILRRMQRAEKLAKFGKFLHLLLVAAAVGVLYLLFQPYFAEIKAFTEMYSNIAERAKEPVVDIVDMMRGFDDAYGHLLQGGHEGVSVEENINTTDTE